MPATDSYMNYYSSAESKKRMGEKGFENARVIVLAGEETVTKDLAELETAGHQLPKLPKGQQYDYNPKTGEVLPGMDGVTVDGVPYNKL